MALNCVFIGDQVERIFCCESTSEAEVRIIEALEFTPPRPVPYINTYIHGLHSLVPSELTYYKNACFETWCDAKLKQHIILPNTSHLLRYYQRALPGSNVLVYFININEQNNYSFEMLRKWKVKDLSKLHHGNPQHPHKLYLSFQTMMIGLSHFVHPPKYLCVVLCGAISQKQFTDKQAFIIQTYSDIIFKKCQRSKDSVLFIKDMPFHSYHDVPPKELHTTLMQRIQQFVSDQGTQHEGDAQQPLFISVYGNQMIRTQNTSYIEFNLFCSILFGSIKLNDRLMLYPMNIEVEIIDMRCFMSREAITFARQNAKISVKIRINKEDILPRTRKWQVSKHFLLSKAAISAFEWNHVHTHLMEHKFAEKMIEIKVYLSSKYNYQKGIFKKQELLISYLGHCYAVNVKHFTGDTRPSVNTMLECRAIYETVNNTYDCQLSDDCLRIVIAYAFTPEQMDAKVGLLQGQRMNIVVEPMRSISFSTKKPLNQFCILAQNEIVAKGKFISASKHIPFNLNETVFDLTQSEKECIMKWIPNVRKYSKMELIHRGSEDGFGAVLVKRKYNSLNLNERKLLIVIQAKESGNIFGGFINHSHMLVRHLYMVDSFMFQLRLTTYNADTCTYSRSTIPPTKWNINVKIGHQINYYYAHQNGCIQIGSRTDGLFLSDACDTYLSYCMRNGSYFEMSRYDRWNLPCAFDDALIQKEFLTQDFEVWHLTY
eukprot:115157_1